MLLSHREAFVDPRASRAFRMKMMVGGGAIQLSTVNCPEQMFEVQCVRSGSCSVLCRRLVVAGLLR